MLTELCVAVEVMSGKSSRGEAEKSTIFLIILYGCGLTILQNYSLVILRRYSLLVLRVITFQCSLILLRDQVSS